MIIVCTGCGATIDDRVSLADPRECDCQRSTRIAPTPAPSRFHEAAQLAASLRPGGAGDPLTLHEAARVLKRAERVGEEQPS